MGQGIDLAREHAPEHAAVLDNLKDQLLLVLIERLGGDITIPVAEVDDTGGKLLSMSLDTVKQEFHFVLGRKQ